MGKGASCLLQESGKALKKVHAAQVMQQGSVSMYFRRKAYTKLLEWKARFSDRYAVMLDGARRVGKSTIAENSAKNEYKPYILPDFSNLAPGPSCPAGIQRIRLNAFEVKSSGTGRHESITESARKFSRNAGRVYLISQKDVSSEGAPLFRPFYLLPFLI